MSFFLSAVLFLVSVFPIASIAQDAPEHLVTDQGYLWSDAVPERNAQVLELVRQLQNASGPRQRVSVHIHIHFPPSQPLGSISPQGYLWSD